MTDFVKVLRDQPLSSGSHQAGDKQACVMEKVSILWALGTGQDVSDVFSDLPACTNHVVAKTAQKVNDRLDDVERQKLNAFIPRLLRARQTPSDRRINVRLAVWSARRVLHLIEDEERRAVALRAIESAEAWLENPSEGTRGAAAAAAAAAADAADAAAYAAYAAAYADAAYVAAYADDAADADAADAAADASAAAAAYASASAAYASAAAAAAAADAYADASSSLISFLDELLDAWEEACSKEGEDIYVPQAWEDEALQFLSEYLDAK